MSIDEVVIYRNLRENPGLLFVSDAGILYFVREDNQLCVVGVDGITITIMTDDEMDRVVEEYRSALFGF